MIDPPNFQCLGNKNSIDLLILESATLFKLELMHNVLIVLLPIAGMLVNARHPLDACKPHVKCSPFINDLSVTCLEPILIA